MRDRRDIRTLNNVVFFCHANELPQPGKTKLAVADWSGFFLNFSLLLKFLETEDCSS